MYAQLENVAYSPFLNRATLLHAVYCLQQMAGDTGDHCSWCDGLKPECEMCDDLHAWRVACDMMDQAQQREKERRRVERWEEERRREVRRRINRQTVALLTLAGVLYIASILTAK